MKYKAILVTLLITFTINSALLLKDPENKATNLALQAKQTDTRRGISQP